MGRKKWRMESHVMNLLESYRAINSTLELDEVLKKIIHFALNIAETAEAGYIQLYDEATNNLVVKTSVGFNERILQFKVKVGESITGKVFRDGKGKLFRSRKEIYESMEDLSNENFKLIDSAHSNNKNIKSMLSVPVSLGNKRIGVMTIHCFEAEDGLSETELLLLQSFASQAAIAIHNAQLHEEVQDSLNKVKETNALLEKQTKIHNHLTRLSVQNKGLHMIVTEINKMMERKLVYADYLEGDYYPKHIKNIEDSLDDLLFLFSNRNRPGYVTIYGSVPVKCYVYPIRSGSIFLGCLVIEEEKKLSELDQLIVEQGAPIVSLEIMKQRSQTEMMYKKTHEMYQRFLNIKNPHQAEIAAKELGIHHHHFLQTVIIELDGNVDSLSLENETLTFIANLKQKLPKENHVLFCYNNKIVYFCALKDNEQEEKNRSIIENSLTWWNERSTIIARAGISSGFYYFGQAEENHMRAEKALLYLKTQNKIGLLHYKDIGISQLFLNHPQEEIHSFLRETFSVLWTVEENRILLQTLFVYIENIRSVSDSAKELHIHPNTLYNRLSKIEEILDIDLNNFEDYLQVQLAVYLYKTYGNHHH